ncbi:helix-turn-helix transcriptional regulator [Flavitalea flava]
MPIPPDIYRKILTAKLFMDENFREAIDLDHISRQACLSRYHFHRLFTRIYKRTPHRYLTQKRIEQARLWLTDNKCSILEICNNIGFESIGSFSVLFKREIGFAPQSYRQNALQKKRQAERNPMAFIPHCFIESLAGPVEKSKIREDSPARND